MRARTRFKRSTAHPTVNRDRNHAVDRALAIFFGLFVALGLVACFGHAGGSGDCDGKGEELRPNSSAPSLFTVAGERLFFLAYNRDNDRYRLWSMDEEEHAEPVEDLRKADISPNLSFYDGIAGFSSFADQLYFVGFRGNTHSKPNRLMRTDGVRSEDAILDWPDEAVPRYQTPLGDFLYFAVEDEERSYSIWRVDADREASFVADLPEGIRPESMGTFGDRLMFTSYNYFVAPRARVWELIPGNEPRAIADVYGEQFAVFDGRFYYSVRAASGLGLSGMWEYDGINPPVRVATGTVFNKYVFDGELYYAQADRNYAVRTYYVTWSGAPFVLWAYDGVNPARRVFVTGGTMKLLNILGSVGDSLLFTTPGTFWRTNGQPPALRISDWYEYRTPSSNSEVRRNYNGLYYYAATDSKGTELWSLDGTEARRVADLHPGKYCHEPDRDDD